MEWFLCDEIDVDAFFFPLPSSSLPLNGICIDLQVVKTDCVSLASPRVPRATAYTANKYNLIIDILSSYLPLNSSHTHTRIRASEFLRIPTHVPYLRIQQPIQTRKKNKNQIKLEEIWYEVVWVFFFFFLFSSISLLALGTRRTVNFPDHNI